jgi:hypothetical protein
MRSRLKIIKAAAALESSGWLPRYSFTATSASSVPSRPSPPGAAAGARRIGFANRSGLYAPAAAAVMTSVQKTFTVAEVVNCRALRETFHGTAGFMNVHKRISLRLIVLTRRQSAM